MTLYATVILILAVLVALKIMALTSKARRRSGPGRVEQTRSATALKPMGEHAEAADAAIPLQQLDMVRRSAYRKRALMNKSEYALFCRLEKFLSSSYPTHRLFAQVSLGEILSSDSRNAYRAVNSKRVDLVITDRAGIPEVVVEYQGSGHYQGDAHLRDAIKREACQSAGISWVEIRARYCDKDIRDIGTLLSADGESNAAAAVC